MTSSDTESAFVLLLTGPAGAGKSAAARAWAKLQPGYVAHIELDNVRDQIVTRFADPRDGWNDEADWQYTIARQNCADMARRYLREGMVCVIDDAIFRCGIASTTRDGVKRSGTFHTYSSRSCHPSLLSKLETLNAAAADY